jgi:ubiquinone/menaquinone biosynthesis methyltransferase
MTRKVDFGFETVAEEEKARRVAGVFDSVAGRYDLMNDLMSGGMHRLWKRFTIEQSGVRPGQKVLDIAGGTGDLARAFQERVGPAGTVLLTDINAAMLARGRDRMLDEGRVIEAVRCDAERLPFPDRTFDCVSVAFGLRNMTHKDRALAEMFRVLRPGGKVLLIHLCAYGEEDKAEYFEVLRLRNPARRNFYLRGDLAALLRGAGFVDVAVHDAIVDEDVDVWSDNKAIDEGRREAIRAVYRSASPAFAALHGVRIEGGQIVDRMLFGLAVGTKPA